MVSFIARDGRVEHKLTEQGLCYPRRLGAGQGQGHGEGGMSQRGPAEEQGSSDRRRQPHGEGSTGVGEMWGLEGAI